MIAYLECTACGTRYPAETLMNLCPADKRPVQSIIDLPRLDKTYDVNLRGAFVWSQLAWRAWMESHGGSIINVSSIGGMTVETSIGHYNVTKAALIHLTKQLLSFAKVGKFVVTPTDLNPIVQRAIGMFSRSRDQIAFNPHLSGGLWLTEVDRVQIGQALLALFMRAADDMPDGGEIFVDTGNVVLDSDFLTPFGLAPGCYVRISIYDSGSGLDTATQKRVFCRTKR